MTDTPTNYPLHWPRGYPRTESRHLAKFRSGAANKHLSIAEALERLETQIDGFTRPRCTSRTGRVIISTNVEPTLTGRPRSNQPEPRDPGVAVYFELDGKPKVFCCDRWTRVADNIAAIAATIEALRGIERWGVAEDERVFAGFSALPAPGDVRATTCWVVLGIPPHSDRTAIDAAWKRLAHLHHPDKPGGSSDRMAEINEARDQAIRSLTA